MIDTTLVKQLGADEYGMKVFALVYLKPGNTPQTDASQATKIQKEHLKYLKSLMEKGTMLLLGPVMEEASIVGICIYNCDIEEAKKLAQADPAVLSGKLSIEIHPWYGSAAIMKIPEIHKTIEAKSFADILQ
ncbi:MAG TPA: YciI family protein [Flavitalea sp.]|nr:YciI family protein [Flavitalea sp.]